MKLNNNMKNRIRLSPLGNSKKLDTSMNNSSKGLVGNKYNNLNKKLISSSFKKVTSAKNVNNNNNTSLNRTIEGEGQTKKILKLQKKIK